MKLRIKDAGKFKFKDRNGAYNCNKELIWLMNDVHRFDSAETIYEDFKNAIYLEVDRIGSGDPNLIQVTCNLMLAYMHVVEIVRAGKGLFGIMPKFDVVRGDISKNFMEFSVTPKGGTKAPYKMTFIVHFFPRSDTGTNLDLSNRTMELPEFKVGIKNSEACTKYTMNPRCLSAMMDTMAMAAVQADDGECETTFSEAGACSLSTTLYCENSFYSPDNNAKTVIQVELTLNENVYSLR